MGNSVRGVRIQLERATARRGHEFECQRIVCRTAVNIERPCGIIHHLQVHSAVDFAIPGVNV